jgi:hypothetical protein
MLTDGTLDPLAVLTLCDTMPMAIYERMGPSDSEWEVVSIDLTTVRCVNTCQRRVKEIPGPRAIFLPRFG